MNGNPERSERTMLVLTSEINAWLDGQCASMRKQTGTCNARGISGSANGSGTRNVGYRTVVSCSNLLSLKDR